MNKNLRYSAYAGIFAGLLLIPAMIFSFLKGAGKLEGMGMIWLVSTNIIYTGLYIWFLWGFIYLADKTKNKLLKIATVLAMVSSVISIGTLFINEETGVLAIVVGVLILMISGVLSIIFGVGLLKLKKKLGSLATACGVINIIIGGCLVTVLLAIIALLLTLPLVIMEIILMFKASEKFK